MDERRRVKVLFIPAWYPPIGAQTRVSGTFCREHVHAAALHDDVAVLVFASRTDRGAMLEMQLHDDCGIPTWYATVGPSPIPRTNWLTFRVQLRRAIGRISAQWGRPDIIHTQDHYAPVVMQCSRWLDASYVISQHWTGFLRGTVSAADVRRFRWAFKRAHRVLAASPNAGPDYDKYNIRASVRWLPNAMDPSVFHPAPDAARKPWLLHASGFTPQKRVADILTAFRILLPRRPNAVLHFAGDGAGRAGAEALAGRLLPAGSFCFHGFLPKPRLAELMRQSRGFVFPSDAETFGCVLIEAMASACPVLTTRVGGIPAVVREKEGLLVGVGDVNAIAEGMERLLDGTHAIDTVTVARTVQERFGRSVVGGLLHEEYLTAVTHARAVRGQADERQAAHARAST